MKKTILPSIFVILALAYTGESQKPDKQYAQWNRDTAVKIVSASPWAKVFTSKENLESSVSRNIATRYDTVNRESNRTYLASVIGNPPIVVRLHSALIVRQAAVRLRQLAIKYDQLSNAEKAAFDTGTEEFLKCSICANNYVVTIAKFARATDMVNDGIFSSVTLEDVKGQVWLVNDAGEKRDLVQFTPSKGGDDPAVFVFNRFDTNGKPLLAPGSKEFDMVFNGSFVYRNKRDAGLYPRRFEFDVQKMIVDGKVVF